MGRAVYLAQGAAAGFFFGTGSIFVRYMPYLDAFTIAFARVSIAGLLLVVAGLLVYRSGFVRQAMKNFSQLPLLGLLLGLHFVFFTLAVKSTSVVNAATLVNTTPAITLALGWALHLVKPSRTNIFGLGLTLAGASSMALGELSFSPHQISGDLFALAGALAWAVYLVAGKRVREASEVMAAAGPIYLWSAAATGLTALMLGGIGRPRAEEVYPLIGLAVFPTVLGHSLQFSSLKKLHPYEASALALLEPVVATLLAAAVLNEVVEPGFYVSAAIIIVGIYLVTR
ncbi:MAG: DMT family transporter [Candidatus Caldarchaeum sp.]|nr:DMT family transporter [Candidatus Caldarchaeum sp.]